MAFYLSTYSPFSSMKLSQRFSNLFKTSEKYVFWCSSKYASVTAIPSSFNLNFCPTTDFFKFSETKGSPSVHFLLGAQSITSFYRFGSTDGGSMSQYVIILEEHFFLTLYVKSTIVEPVLF